MADVKVGISQDLITSVFDFYTKVKNEDEVWISFIKKDGTERIMHCTLNFSKIPADKKPKDVNLQKILNLIKVHKLLRVFDLEIEDWRSVPFTTVQYLETPEKKGSHNRVRYQILR